MVRGVKWVGRMVPRSWKERIKAALLMDVRDSGARECFGQNGEDICLQNYFAARSWRRNGKYGRYECLEPGFYVDVGACMPTLLSNTYWFYQRGWRGINIDVLPETKALFDRERPRDINLCAAVSNRESERTYFSWGAKSVFNTLSPELAAERAAKLGEPKRITVSTLTLRGILDRHLPLGQTVSFLSVDVEGHDLEVLESNDWGKYRPRMVVVEDDKPLMADVLNSSITRFLAGVGYKVQSWLPPSVAYAEIADSR